MNFSGGPPSFPSAPINSNRQGPFLPNGNDPTSPDDINNQAPSQGSLGGYDPWNSQHQFQGGGVTGHRGFGQTGETDDRDKSPSLTDLGRVNHSNQFQDVIGNRSLGYTGGNGYDYADQAPGFDDIARGNNSNPSGGGGNLFTGENKPPTISDVGQRETSQTGNSSSMTQISPEDQQLVGMSLVGRNFKKFYPNAYYKEKDEY